MRALTAVPGRAGPLAVLDVPDPAPDAEDLLVDGLAVGVRHGPRDRRRRIRLGTVRT
jgi:hypothetical protein